MVGERVTDAPQDEVRGDVQGLSQCYDFGSPWEAGSGFNPAYLLGIHVGHFRQFLLGKIAIDTGMGNTVTQERQIEFTIRCDSFHGPNRIAGGSFSFHNSDVKGIIGQI